MLSAFLLFLLFLQGVKNVDYRLDRSAEDEYYPGYMPCVGSEADYEVQRDDDRPHRG
jgi:hypothetical protein